ncbi:hypothetical protein LEMLEM_LOCUS4471 [Lemmus lemmus]
MRKHHGGDRTGTHTSQASITSELAEVINDGLYYSEQDLWTESENARTAIKVTISEFRTFHGNEAHLLLAAPIYFKKMMGIEEAPYGVC